MNNINYYKITSRAAGLYNAHIWYTQTIDGYYTKYVALDKNNKIIDKNCNVLNKIRLVSKNNGFVIEEITAEEFFVYFL